MAKEKTYNLVLTQTEVNDLFKHGLRPLIDFKNLFEGRLLNQVKNVHYKVSPLEYEYVRRHNTWVPLEGYEKAINDSEKYIGEVGKFKGKRVVLVKQKHL